ncbi:MAG TPA: TonB C-terminal domain-containing protein [Candidatus Acidoferrum sp.]|nr:TonB C-terminal domain-containing protein [Candidatus Acidoferrum sp.]
MSSFSMLSVCASGVLSVFLSLPAFSQGVRAPEATGGEVLLENKNVRAVRFAILPSSIVTLPVLKNDSLLVILDGEAQDVWSSANRAQTSRLGFGEVSWLRRDEENFVHNTDLQPSRILVIEFKDSYAMDQIQVPGSLRDPVNFDTRHFRLVLENQHARVFWMHLEPRETTEEVQFPLHLEIPFGSAQVSVFEPDGKFEIEHKEAGVVAWHRNRLVSLSNQETRPFEELVVELRHPFCYKTSPDMPSGSTPVIVDYAQRVYGKVRKQWFKRLPMSAREGEEAVVTVRIKIQADGKTDEDDMFLAQVFAGNKLTENALRAVREAAPFPAIPPDWGKPQVDFGFTFLYNLRPEPQPGCEK